MENTKEKLIIDDEFNISLWILNMNMNKTLSISNYIVLMQILSSKIFPDEYIYI